MQEQKKEEEEKEREREEGGGPFFKGIINSLNALVVQYFVIIMENC